MQPLDVSFFGPLKTAYSSECNDFLTAKPGETIAVEHVPGLYYKAYAKVATLNNAIKGFEATGTVPLNSQLFTEDDYEPSATTDISIADVNPTGTDNLAEQPTAPDNIHQPPETTQPIAK